MACVKAPVLFSALPSGSKIWLMKSAACSACSRLPPRPAKLPKAAIWFALPLRSWPTSPVMDSSRGEPEAWPKPTAFCPAPAKERPRTPICWLIASSCACTSARAAPSSKRLPRAPVMTSWPLASVPRYTSPPERAAMPLLVGPNMAPPPPPRAPPINPPARVPTPGMMEPMRAPARAPPPAPIVPPGPTVPRCDPTSELVSMPAPKPAPAPPNRLPKVVPMPMGPRAVAGSTGPIMPDGSGAVAIAPALVVNSGVESRPPAPERPSEAPRPENMPPDDPPPRRPEKPKTSPMPTEGMPDAPAAGAEDCAPPPKAPISVGRAVPNTALVIGVTTASFSKSAATLAITPLIRD